jgi:hypothetical protein
MDLLGCLAKLNIGCSINSNHVQQQYFLSPFSSLRSDYFDRSVCLSVRLYAWSNP